MEGAKAAYDAVSTTYGPKGMNVSIEKGFGRPVYTRDGITVLRDTFFSDRSKNIGTQAIMEASESSNRIAGDGSTAVALLSYHTLHNAVQAVRGGMHPMDVSDLLVQDSRVLLEELKKHVIPVKDEKLKDVATVSSGDPLIGQLIAEAILYVGEDGGILTEKAPINEIEREYVDGYYMQSGFTALQAGKKEIEDPFVIISSKRITSGVDAIEILEGVMRANNLQPGQIPRILFVGNFEETAYNTIVNAVNRQQIDAVIIKTPPMYGEYGKFLLSDLALYANCQPITETTKVKEFLRQDNGRYYSPYIGTVKKVVASKSESTVFGDNDLITNKGDVAASQENLDKAEKQLKYVQDQAESPQREPETPEQKEAYQTWHKEINGKLEQANKEVESAKQALIKPITMAQLVANRVAEIKDQLEAEEVPAIAEKLRDRIAKLEGKIALFKIGAPSDTTREEIEFRIEDAINSTRHAYREGIVPGGGVTLLTLSKADVSDITRKALRSTFQQLLINANLPSELKLDQALNAKPGYGYNLKKSDKLVDVVKDGVIDPFVVVREVITHAMNIASETIKTGKALVFEDNEK